MGNNVDDRKVTIIAHRGGSGLFLENSLEAFRKSEKLGVDAIESDVHLTKDGKIVVMHDDNFLRITGINRLIRDVTLQELSEITLSNGENIPTLEEVMDAVSIPLVIELKSKNMVEAMINFMRERDDVASRSVIVSFFHSAILSLKMLFPELSTGALLAGYPVDPGYLARSCGTDTISFNFEGMNPDYVNLCHSTNVKVAVWTPNSREEIDRCIEAGVDAIASDRPDIVLEELGRFRGH